MEEIKKLLAKYWENTASEDELRELLSRLHGEDKDIRAFLEKEFAGEQERRLSDGVKREEDEYTRQMGAAVLGKINRQIDEQEGQELNHTQFPHLRSTEPSVVKAPGKIIRIPFRKLGLAAAAMGAIVLCAHLLKRKEAGKEMAAAGLPPIGRNKPETKQVANNTNQPENIRLEDGSQVVLYPNSSISYREPFDSLRRNVDMHGKALFKVAGDIKRPFTVIAGNLATTALGTEFLVNAQPEAPKISVRLLEGKVVVRALTKALSNNLVYLKPGEELTIDPQLTQYAVRSFADPADKKSVHRKKHIEEISVLSFSKEPLSNVFTTIEKMYHVRIRYKEKAIRQLSFTGDFFPSDSLEIVITAICNTNDLSFEEKDNIITITPGK